MGGPWQLSFPITSFHGTTRTLCRPGANRLFITSDAGPSCAGHSQTRKLHKILKSSHLSESQCLQSAPEPSIRRPRPLRTNPHAVRRQRGWNLFSQHHSLSLAGPTQGRGRGPNQQRHLSRTPASGQQPAQEHHTPPTYINLCAGIGEFPLVLKKHGLKCVYANEPDPQNRTVFELNHAPDLPGLTLDHRDITKVPHEHIPDHTLLAAWVPLRHSPQQFEKRASWRTRILEIVEAKNPPIVLVGTPYFRRGGHKPDGPPTKKTESYTFAMNTARDLEALGYRTTFVSYDHASFDLPLSRWNLFVVGIRAEQNAPFEFKPPPGRSPGLGLHRVLLPPETIQHVQDTLLMRAQLVDGVWLLQHQDTNGKIGRLDWANPDALPPSANKTPYVPVGHWLVSDGSNMSSQLICHHRGFARGLMKKHGYLVPGPDGRPMVRQLFLREATRLQGFPDEFLHHRKTQTAAQQIGASAPPPMLDWIVKAMKKQYPHIFSTADKSAPKIEAGSQARRRG